MEANELYSLEGKKVWIFGSAGHLGTAIVSALLERGASLHCIDKDWEGKSNKSRPSRTCNQYDVTTITDFKEFVDSNAREFGTPNGCVILTYGASKKSLDEVSPEEVDKANQLNITATLMLCREIANRMARHGGGSIILFGSMYGIVSPNPANYPEPIAVNPIEYGIGKAGTIHMTRYLAIAYARRNVRINCISPGAFPHTATVRLSAEHITRLEKNIPMGRIGEPQEIVGPVLFFLSEASSYVCGANLIVDGGWTLW